MLCSIKNNGKWLILDESNTGDEEEMDRWWSYRNILFSLLVIQNDQLTSK